MVQLIKKGGLRERANRSRRYQGSENTEATLKPNQYRQPSTAHQELISTPEDEQQLTEQITPEESHEN